VAVAIQTPAVPVAPVGDLGLDGLGEELLGALTQDLGQDVLRFRQWYNANLGARKTHGGVLLCLVGTLVNSDTPGVRRLLLRRHPQDSIIPPPLVRCYCSVRTSHTFNRSWFMPIGLSHWGCRESRVMPFPVNATQNQLSN
jgi:hypothetical protein